MRWVRHVWACGHERKYVGKASRRVAHIELCPACHYKSARDVRAYLDLMADMRVRHGRR
jgi:hypothetical protein